MNNIYAPSLGLWSTPVLWDSGLILLWDPGLIRDGRVQDFFDGCADRAEKMSKFLFVDIFLNISIWLPMIVYRIL